jgi:hypothetical protein
MQNKPRSYDSVENVYIQDFVYGIPEELSNFEDMPKFSRFGYNFVGWSQSIDSNKITYENEQSVENLATEEDATVDLYAVWEPKKYIIQYNPNGTIGPVYYQTAFYDSTFSLSDNQFELSNIEFLGWSLSDENLSIDFEKNSVVTNLIEHDDFSKPVNLFPVFSVESKDEISDIIDKIEEEIEDIELSVQYNSNCLPGKTKCVQVDENFKVETYFFENENKNKTFKNWSKFPEKNSGILSGMLFSELSNIVSPISGLINLYAFWSYPYFIEFNKKTEKYDFDVSGKMEKQSCPYDVKTKISKNRFLSKWHSFIGWTTNYNSENIDFEDEQEILNLTSENDTINLYALWNDKYVINYHFEDHISSQNCQYDLSTELSNGNDIFSKPNYKCVGWSSLDNPEVIFKNNEIIKNISVINGNQSNLSAQFVKYYTIKYNNGVPENLSSEITGEMSPQECLVDKTYNLNLNQFIRKNKIFKNWKDKNNKIYENGALISNLVAKDEFEITLSVEWDDFEIKYRIIDKENHLAFVSGIYGNPEAITIPSSYEEDNAQYTVVGIDSYAFYDNYNYNPTENFVDPVPCSNLKNITLPDTISVVNNYAFAKLKNLETVENFEDINEISSINTGVFQNCNSLVDITLPTSILSVYPSAFYNCYYFNSIDFSNITYIGANAFLGCTSLQNLNLSNINNIETGAFKQCTGISSIFIGENVSLPLDEIFTAEGLNNLKVFEISKNNKHITKIQDKLFSGSNELSDVQLNDISLIGNSAFEYCNDLSSIDFPDSLKYIGDNCFLNTSLRTVDIPSAVSYIGENVFYMCEDLSAINVDDNNPYYYDIDGVLYKHTANYDLSDIVEMLADLRDELTEIKENN